MLSLLSPNLISTLTLGHTTGAGVLGDRPVLVDNSRENNIPHLTCNSLHFRFSPLLTILTHGHQQRYQSPL
jgi:hypothetical protein